MMRKSIVNQYHPYGEDSYIVYPLETFDFIPEQLGKAVGRLLDIEADEQRAKHYSAQGFWTSGTVDCSPGEVYGIIPLVYRGYVPPPADLMDGLDDSDSIDWTGAAMTKWEYYRAHILWDDNEVWQRSLDALGSEGWEMVGFEAAEVEGMRRCYFKRAIPEAPQGLLVYHDPVPQKRDFGKEERDALDSLGKELFYEDDDSDRWHDTWQKLDEYMRDQ